MEIANQKWLFGAQDRDGGRKKRMQASTILTIEESLD